MKIKKDVTVKKLNVSKNIVNASIKEYHAILLVDAKGVRTVPRTLWTLNTLKIPIIALQWKNKFKIKHNIFKTSI